MHADHSIRLNGQSNGIDSVTRAPRTLQCGRTSFRIEGTRQAQRVRHKKLKQAICCTVLLISTPPTCCVSIDPTFAFASTRRNHSTCVFLFRNRAPSSAQLIPCVSATAHAARECHSRDMSTQTSWLRYRDSDLLLLDFHVLVNL